MIIRSQNARGIVNLNNIDSITVKEYSHDICAFNGTMESEILLGKYSTEEKAIKVLDMIQEAYCKMKNSDCIFSGSSIDLCKASQEKIDHFIETNRSLYVFEMPQDSEV
jgi:hypothetical protein